MMNHIANRPIGSLGQVIMDPYGQTVTSFINDTMFKGTHIVSKEIEIRPGTKE